MLPRPQYWRSVVAAAIAAAGAGVCDRAFAQQASEFGAISVPECEKGPQGPMRILSRILWPPDRIPPGQSKTAEVHLMGELVKFRKIFNSEWVRLTCRRGEGVDQVGNRVGTLVCRQCSIKRIKGPSGGS